MNYASIGFIMLVLFAFIMLNFEEYFNSITNKYKPYVICMLIIITSLLVYTLK